MEESIGKKLADLRQQRGMTVRSLAEKSGVNPATISRIENSQVSASMETLEKLCDAMGAKVELVDDNVGYNNKYAYDFGLLVFYVNKKYELTMNQIRKSITDAGFLKRILFNLYLYKYGNDPEFDKKVKPIIDRAEKNEWKQLTLVEQGTAWVGFYHADGRI